MMLNSPGLRSIAVNSLHLVSARGLTQIARAAYVIVLARYLGPELYGLLVLAQSWYLTFLAFTGFGIAAVLSQTLSQGRYKLEEIGSYTLSLRLTGALAAAVLSIAIGYAMEGPPLQRMLISIFSLALIARALCLWTEHIFTAAERARYVAIFSAVLRISEVAASLLWVLLEGGLLGFAVIHAASWSLQALAGAWIISRRFFAIRLRWSWPDIRFILILGLPVAVAFIAHNWLLYGPVVIFKNFGGSPEELGELGLALQGFNIASAIPLSIGAAALPVLSRVARHAPDQVQRFTDFACEACIYGGTAVALLGAAYVDEVVVLAFGSKFLGAAPLAASALWLCLPYALSTILLQVLLSGGRAVLGCAGSILGAAIMTALSPPLIALLGPQGAIVAAGAGLSTWSAFMLVMLSKRRQLNLLPSLLVPGAAAAAAVTANIAVGWGSHFGLAAGIAVLALFAAASRMARLA